MAISKTSHNRCQHNTTIGRGRRGRGDLRMVRPEQRTNLLLLGLTLVLLRWRSDAFMILPRHQQRSVLDRRSWYHKIAFSSKNTIHHNLSSSSSSSSMLWAEGSDGNNDDAGKCIWRPHAVALTYRLY